MISVQNHRQPSSGNKFFWLLLCLLPLFTSCELFQKAQTTSSTDDEEEEIDPIQGRRVYDSETGEYVVIEEAVTEVMDTIIWEDIPPSSDPPITSETDLTDQSNPVEVLRIDNFGSEVLSSYNVSILLPFLTDQFNETSATLPRNADWAVNFYAGAKMALDELSSEGVVLNVNVMDSKADPSSVNRLLRSNEQLLNSHMIIGPRFKDNVSMVSEYAKRYDKVLVSPYTAVTNVTNRNPNYIQVNPSLQTHCEAITRHALQRYRPDQIVLVCRDQPTEVAMLQYFQEEFFRIAGTRDTTQLQEFIISDASVDLENIDVLPFVELADTTVFIVPSGTNENFVYSFLRKVDIARDENTHIAVYGLPQWLRFLRMDYAYYERLNVHISSSSYLDPLSPDVQFFKRRFYDRFGIVPADEAFTGYDIMLYFGRMLNKYGTKFQYSIDREMERGLHTRFEFDKVVIPTVIAQENLPVERFENQYVNILRFRDYQFQLAE